MSDQALILIDIQNDYFAGGKCVLANMESAANNAAQALATARQAGELVVHVRHEFPADRAPFFAAGSPGAQIHPTVPPAPGESVVLKHFPNAFRETNLKAILDGAGIAKVTIVGSMSHMCVDDTVRAAADFGYSMTVLHDACATRAQEFGGTAVSAEHVHAAFMAGLGFAYASMTSTREYVAAAQTGSASHGSAPASRGAAV